MVLAAEAVLAPPRGQLVAQDVRLTWVKLVGDSQFADEDFPVPVFLYGGNHLLVAPVDSAVHEELEGRFRCLNYFLNDQLHIILKRSNLVCEHSSFFSITIDKIIFLINHY